MPSYNRVVLVGNVTRDVEIKYLQSGTAVADIGLAVNRNYKTAAGEKRKEVCFVTCTAWGRTAEIAKEYLAKGRPVLIEGRLKQDTWEAKDGSKREKLGVVVENLQFLGSRGESSKSEPRPSEPEPGSDRAPADEADDSVPF